MDSGVGAKVRDGSAERRAFRSFNLKASNIPPRKQKRRGGSNPK